MNTDLKLLPLFAVIRVYQCQKMLLRNTKFKQKTLDADRRRSPQMVLLDPCKPVVKAALVFWPRHEQ
ncbi:MAG: hypothetical protein ACREP2_07360 [Rhodanobacteraceae bacterium]